MKPKEHVIPVLEAAHGVLMATEWRPVRSDPKKYPQGMSLVEAVSLASRIYAENLEAALTEKDVWHRPVEEQVWHFIDTACDELVATIRPPRKGDNRFNAIEHFSALPTTTHEKVLKLIADTIRRCAFASPAPATALT